MATELITRILCDIHLVDKDEQVTGATYTWGKSAVDLCEECAAPLVTAQGVFDTYGTKTGRRTPKPKKEKAKAAETAPADTSLVCPLCGRQASSRDNLSSHARNVHDQSLGQLLGEDVPFVCDIGGCGKAYGTRQGLRMHQTRSHPGGESAAG